MFFSKKLHESIFQSLPSAWTVPQLGSFWNPHLPHGPAPGSVISRGVCSLGDGRCADSKDAVVQNVHQRNQALKSLDKRIIYGIKNEYYRIHETIHSDRIIQRIVLDVSSFVSNIVEVL